MTSASCASSATRPASPTVAPSLAISPRAEEALGGLRQAAVRRRYTHRVAISNSRLIAIEDSTVTFRCKDYRRSGAERYGTMTLAAGEFIRRFLLHALPRGFHRIRHYGLLAASARKGARARARELLAVPPPDPAKPIDPPESAPYSCCGGRMHLVGLITREALIRGASMREAWAR